MFWRKQKEPVRQPRLMAGQDDYVFRRSRTLTGSVSSQVTATAEKRGQLKTDRLKLHELKAHRRHVLRLLGVVLLALGVMVFLLANFIVSPQIASAEPGVRQADASKYHQAIYTYFGDHPLERFGFALNAEEFQEHLKQSHDEVRSVTVERDWYGGDVRFILYFRQPLLVWRSAGQQFYVDNQGVAFDYNHFVEPTVAVEDQSGITPDQASGAVASTRFLGFLGRTVGAINSYNKGKVVAVIIPRSTRQIDIKLEGRDYIIKTHIDRDPLQQAEDIANALKYFDVHGIKPQYVDVRVAHKAFYKN
ncbi:MAG: hypothetical protein ACREGJ_00815 [Candidatus Saccharimonadales bacterium]